MKLAICGLFYTSGSLSSCSFPSFFGENSLVVKTTNSAHHYSGIWRQQISFKKMVRSFIPFLSFATAVGVECSSEYPPSRIINLLRDTYSSWKLIQFLFHLVPNPGAALCPGSVDGIYFFHFSFIVSGFSPFYSLNSARLRPRPHHPLAPRLPPALPLYARPPDGLMDSNSLGDEIEDLGAFWGGKKLALRMRAGASAKMKESSGKCVRPLRAPLVYPSRG